MKRTKVIHALNAEQAQDSIRVMGWLRTKRDSKGFSFLELNDGSCLKNLQIIVDHQTPGFEQIRDLGTGSSVAVTGKLVESPGKGQQWEVQAAEVELLGRADLETYPLQKKRHSDEFLRTIAQLRPRTNKYGALNRIRSELAFAIHDFFHDRGFTYIHSPIITASDCEGAGELFQVTSLDLDAQPTPAERREHDFFGKDAYLTVSGQLTAEVMACALGDVYTFGPTFRAENSNTPRHAAEFWMVEPEMAFADLGDAIDLGEELLKSVVDHIRTRCAQDLDLFTRFVDKELAGHLDMVAENEFVRLPYAEAIEILEKAHPKRNFDYPPGYGVDLQTEHERYLAETHFKKPVAIYDFPIEIKPFYMRVNEGEKTVAALDVLLPRVGELIGGSQREERLDVLVRRMEDLGLKPEDYSWYLDLRRFGTVPHAGFGLGFERLLMFLTGVRNIRDVLPFPRTPKHLEF